MSQLIEQERIHRENFYQLLAASELEEELSMKKIKPSNSKLRANQYEELIADIELGSIPNTKKSCRLNYIAKKYEVLEITGIKTIIRRRTEKDTSIKQLIKYEDLFDTILRCHKAVGHKGRDLMNHECSKKHLNITISIINSN